MAVQVPWFIGLFLVASLARSFVPAIAARTPLIQQAARIGLAVVLFVIGAGLSMRTLRAVGWRAVVQGLALWAFISIGSLVVVRLYMP